MIGWFFRLNSAKKEEHEQLEKLKQEDRKQRLFIKDALLQLARARNLPMKQERND